MTDFNAVAENWNDNFTDATSGNLDKGKGFYIRAEENSLIEFTGEVQHADLTIDGEIDKWNFAGNPYTSAIRINSAHENETDFLSVNTDKLDPAYGAIYMWNEPDETNGFIANYTVISNASAPTDIQQGQAFFVKFASEASTIDFTTEMQIHNPLLQQKPMDQENHLVRLSAASGEADFSTLFSFQDGMTNGMDATYDAGLFTGNANLLLYSLQMEDNAFPLAIQALPVTRYSEITIPLGVDFKTGGEVVFTADLMNMPNSSKVILEDTQNESSTDLAQENYTVSLESDFNSEERFKLRITFVLTGSKINYNNSNLKVHVNSYKNLIIEGKTSSYSTMKLFDLQGRINLLISV